MTDETKPTEDGGTQVQVAAPADQTAAAPVATTAQKKKTGDLIFDVAAEIAGYGKVKALNTAERLAEDIDTNFFRLGGLLKLILKEQWFEGYPTFEAFVLEKFGFAKRKADYLIAIYTHLVDKQIPWEKVNHLGWTKLKDLAAFLTPENVDEMVAKVKGLSYQEMMAVLKPPAGEGGGKASTTSNVVSMKFGFHADQAEIVQKALAKAKGELQTEHDNVALSGICGGYLANASGVANDAGPVDVQALLKGLGLEAVIDAVNSAFPDVSLSLEMSQPPTA